MQAVLGLSLPVAPEAMEVHLRHLQVAPLDATIITTIATMRVRYEYQESCATKCNKRHCLCQMSKSWVLAVSKTCRTEHGWGWLEGSIVTQILMVACLLGMMTMTRSLMVCYKRRNCMLHF